MRTEKEFENTLETGKYDWERMNEFLLDAIWAPHLEETSDTPNIVFVNDEPIIIKNHKKMR